jgi:hypothetical protein
MILSRVRPPAGRYTALLPCLILALLGSAPGHTAPPENSDGRYSEWFKSLKQPGTDNSCCDLSDCRSVKVRVGEQGYEALISKPDFPIEFPTWVAIPADKILQGKDNPLGQAVVCWRPHPGVICFVQGAGS